MIATTIRPENPAKIPAQAVSYSVTFFKESVAKKINIPPSPPGNLEAPEPLRNSLRFVA
jgi:hypothetical protein